MAFPPAFRGRLQDCARGGQPRARRPGGHAGQDGAKPAQKHRSVGDLPRNRVAQPGDVALQTRYERRRVGRQRRCSEHADQVVVTASGGGDSRPLPDLRPDRLDVAGRAQFEAVEPGIGVKGAQIPAAHPRDALAGGESVGKLIEHRFLDAGIAFRDNDRPAEGRPAQLHDQPGISGELVGLLRPETRECLRLRDLRAYGCQPRLLGCRDTGRRRMDLTDETGKSIFTQRVHGGEGGALGLQLGKLVA